MAYSDFDLLTAVETFGLREERAVDLFAGVAPLEPSDTLRAILDEFAPVALGLNTETARREYITTPFLMDAKRRAAGPVNVLPGATLDADRDRGLFGYCDYLIARSDEIYYLRGPLAAVVEAKREDVIGGLGQCTAAMVGIRVFNERSGMAFPAIYGSVSSGSVWKFLRLEGNVLTLDQREYYLHQAGLILAILVQIMGGPKPGGGGGVRAA